MDEEMCLTEGCDCESNCKTISSPIHPQKIKKIKYQKTSHKPTELWFAS